MFQNVIEFSNLTRTAQEAADQIGCEIGQIAKSIIFKDGNGEPVLVIASGKNYVDTKIIQKQIKNKIEKADAEYCKEKTGFVIGGIPPYDHKQPIRTLIDADLMEYKEIWASAGKSNTVFKLTPKELVLNSKGQIINSKTQSP
jgi:prolyl-tRNA editing enzyme YbaK/EbsC (Cys-tRNA(Pro) deacylase)